MLHTNQTVFFDVYKLINSNKIKGDGWDLRRIIKTGQYLKKKKKLPPTSTWFPFEGKLVYRSVLVERHLIIVLNACILFISSFQVGLTDIINFVRLNENKISLEWYSLVLCSFS